MMSMRTPRHAHADAEHAVMSTQLTLQHVVQALGAGGVGLHGQHIQILPQVLGNRQKTHLELGNSHWGLINCKTEKHSC